MRRESRQCKTYNGPPAQPGILRASGIGAGGNRAETGYSGQIGVSRFNVLVLYGRFSFQSLLRLTVMVLDCTLWPQRSWAWVFQTAAHTATWKLDRSLDSGWSADIDTSSVWGQQWDNGVHPHAPEPQQLHQHSHFVPQTVVGRQGVCESWLNYLSKAYCIHLGKDMYINFTPMSSKGIRCQRDRAELLWLCPRRGPTQDISAMCLEPIFFLWCWLCLMQRLSSHLWWKQGALDALKEFSWHHSCCAAISRVGAGQPWWGQTACTPPSSYLATFSKTDTFLSKFFHAGSTTRSPRNRWDLGETAWRNGCAGLTTGAGCGSGPK